MYKLTSRFLKINNLHLLRKVINPCDNSNVFFKSKRLSTSTTMFKSSVFNLQDATKDQVQEFLDSFDTVLTDCDGE